MVSFQSRTIRSLGWFRHRVAPWRFAHLLLLCGFLIILSCGTTNGQYEYRQPIKTGDGLTVAGLDQVDMDVELISSAIDEILDGEFAEIHSFLILKNGRLVLEEYFAGHDYQWNGPNFHGAMRNWDRDMRHNVHSVGKSITSACIGIALDKGFIGSVKQSIFDYLPEHTRFQRDGKEQITIEHLLTMTSGLQWDEWGSSYSSQTNDVIALWMNCGDPIACILEKPLVGQPGAKFIYSGGNMILLGEIVKNATGLDIESFAAEHLFEPMGITPAKWVWINDTGVIYAGGDQRLTPREMLKFGLVYLNGGVGSGGHRVVSEQWTLNSARPWNGPENSWFNQPFKTIPPGDSSWGDRGYSYSWWTHIYKHRGKEYPAYFALGFGGQKIVVFPEQEAVVVFTAGNYAKADASAEILTDFVIPAFDN